MITQDDARQTVDIGDRYAILPALKFFDIKETNYPSWKYVADDFVYQATATMNGLMPLAACRCWNIADGYAAARQQSACLTMATPSCPTVFRTSRMMSKSSVRCTARRIPDNRPRVASLKRHLPHPAARATRLRARMAQRPCIWLHWRLDIQPVTWSSRQPCPFSHRSTVFDTPAPSLFLSTAIRKPGWSRPYICRSNRSSAAAAKGGGCRASQRQFLRYGGDCKNRWGARHSID